MPDIIQSGAVYLDQLVYNFAKSDKPPNYVPAHREIGNIKVDVFNGFTIALIATVAFGVLGVIPVSSMIVLGVAFFTGRVIAEASFQVVREERGLNRIIQVVYNAMVPAAQRPTAYYTFNDVVVFYKRFS